jgi:hypothetical protein
MKPVLLLPLLFLFSCTKAQHKAEPYAVNVSEVAKDVLIPKQMLKELDNELGEEFKNTPPLYSFIPVNVKFEELQPGVLSKPSLQYNFPKGGGAIDLKDVVSSDGSFYMSFPEVQFEKENDLLHIYFISNSPKKSIDGESFGMGCGKWSDLKGSFSRLKKPDYLKLNTSDLRYLRVVAGTFVFIFRQGKNIYLNQVTITDSRHQGELCNSGSGA